MEYDGGARRKPGRPRTRSKKSRSRSRSKKSRSRSRSRSKKSRSRSRSRSRPRTYTKRKQRYQRPRHYLDYSSDSSDDLTLSRTINYYTLVDEYGNPLGGRYSGYSPLQAIKKLRDPWWNGRNSLQRVLIRQTSPGPSHGRVYVFNVKRKQVPAPRFIRDRFGYDTIWNKTPTLLSTINSNDVALALARQKSILDYLESKRNQSNQRKQ